ncbi:uroporphyrinogen-III synthase [Actinomyces bovis]|uniref:Uroporphyrinogen-III synthase n=1 Tax=Actinomyces bovis TaxID=1658 RepID=A0ABY1VQJ0_9ACTO|nr:uroporphyrinogen-III synthase [Actinomyces bovis]SPT54310.1 uroporphyrinogen-III synthase [Actinomyces bovis]VEG56333.1 uroporphyrinogen-III synthase [Actinomyces israelii]
MSRALSGCRVLLTRARQGDALALALQDAGAQVEAVALTGAIPGEAAVRERAQGLAASGEAAWLLLTSARTLDFLDLSGLATSMRVGVVGEATAQAVAKALGRRVDLVAGGSAAGMLEAEELADPAVDWRGLSRRVLLPGSAQSSPLLAAGLRARGWQVEVLPVYSTQTVPVTALPEGLAERYQAGNFDVVVVTAGSGARALKELLGTPPVSTVVATLGQPSAQVARDLGLPVPPGAVAQKPRAEALVAAVAAAYEYQGVQA